VPGREVAPRWARRARQSARERLLAPLWSAQRQECRHSALEPLSEAFRPAQQPQADRSVGLAAWLAEWLARSSWCPRQVASAAVCRRAAAEPSSGFRRAV